MAAMQLGIGTYAYRWGIGRGDRMPPHPLSAGDILDKAAALGVSLVQYADNLPLDRLSDAELTALAAKARRMGIGIELGMEGLVRAPLERYLDIAGILRARLIRVAPTATDAGRSNAELVTELRTVLPAFRDRQVALALENHFHLQSPRLLDLVAGVGDPLFGVCLDVANSIACGEWPMDTVQMLAPHALNLHLKDYRIAIDPYGVGLSFTGAPLGQGLTDIEAVFAALAAAGRQVNVILEHWLPMGQDMAETLRREDEWLAHGLATVRNALSRQHIKTA
jgi:sugar phosphate isomerase/epimerase